jgi:hypothetical protein
MWLEDFLLKRAEKKILPYRISAQSIDLKIYRQWLPRIQKIYSDKKYWHGTGRYHYMYESGSRYENPKTVEYFDVLNSIIEHKGLIPHHDPWINSGGKTVSLGTVRMHSRLFARIHLYERDALFYELGNVQYWVRLYACLLFVWLLIDLGNCKQFLKSLFQKSAPKNLQAWASAIRKPRNGKVISIWHFINGESPDSDIEGNYPILIGITRDKLEVIDSIPLTHAVEVRSLKIVDLDAFTHIEVPLAKVAETESFLGQKKYHHPSSSYGGCRYIPKRCPC